jgi:5-formyltetrahydrofolate cyclo-ligase
MSLSTAKQMLREASLARRLTIDEATARAAAAAAADNALGWLGLMTAKAVALYSPVRGELDPTPLATRLSAAGVQLLLPMVIDPKGPLVFRAWLPDDPLEPGYARIPEPRADAAISRPDVLIVPLAAFDRRCFRVGYGGGHYDRTLAALRAEGDVLAIGYAYAGQEVDRVPSEPFDQMLDAVVTEREVVVPPSLSAADEPAA